MHTLGPCLHINNSFNSKTNHGTIIWYFHANKKKEILHKRKSQGGGGGGKGDQNGEQLGRG